MQHEAANLPAKTDEKSERAEVGDGSHFGQRLRSLRLDRGLSYRMMGRNVGRPHSQIARWEEQALAPKQQSLARIAEALNCQISDLLPPVHEKENTSGTDVFTNKVTTLEERIVELTQEMEILRDEREGLRKLVLEVATAIRTKDKALRAKASMALKDELVAEEIRQMAEAVDSIRGLENELPRRKQRGI